MKLSTILTILVGFTLVLSVVNSFVIFSINGKFNKILSGEIPEQNGQEQPEQPSEVKVSEGSHVKGSADAPVTIVEFSDFQCPYCGRFYTQTLPQIEENYIKTGKVKFAYRHFPLSFHQYAQKSAEASECADEQGKFWEYHNKVYENQQTLSLESLKQFAKDLSLDTGKFDECLDSGKMESKVKKDFAEGQAAGVQGTPAFFINGVSLVGAQPYSAFEQVIENSLKE